MIWRAQDFMFPASKNLQKQREIALDINSETPGLLVYETPQDEWRSAFDLVLALEVLEHIRDDAASLRQWHSWLKPGGHLLLSVPAHSSHWSATDEWAGHFRRYERHELLKLLGGQGFVAVAAECYGFPLANMLGPLRARYHARQLSRRFVQNQADFTRRSGIERSLEARLYPLQASLAGTLVMKLFFALQTLFLKPIWATDFLYYARKIKERFSLAWLCYRACSLGLFFRHGR